MLDVQELEPRSGETCVVRHIERLAFDRLRKANQELAEQNDKVLEVAEGWLDEFESEGSSRS